eukprot:263713_1
MIRYPNATIFSHYYFFVGNKQHYNHTLNESMDFEFTAVFNSFTSGLIPHGCYFDYYLKWYKYYKNNENNGVNNTLFVYYEDLKQDPIGQLQQIALFLGKNNLNDESLVNIANRISFDNVKKDVLSNPQSFFDGPFGANYFRKGEINSYKEILTKEQDSMINDMILVKWKDNASDLKYYQDLLEDTNIRSKVTKYPFA